MEVSRFIVSADSVIFAYLDGSIYIPLYKRSSHAAEPFPDYWSLAGGPIQDDESPKEACRRKLEEDLQLKVEYLEQLYTFGDPARDPRKRSISIAYFALTRLHAEQLANNLPNSTSRWFPIKDLPKSKWAFDHKRIVNTAIKRLKAKVTYEPIGFNLLDAEFSIPQLQSLYESILGRKLDRRNFAKKINSFKLLIPTKTIQAGRGRPTQLHKFDTQQYNRLQKEGFVFEI